MRFGKSFLKNSIAAMVLAASMQAEAIALTPSPEWKELGGNTAQNRFSPLHAINEKTVGRLGFAAGFEDFVVRGRTHHGVEATPLMVGRTLYFTGPWSVVYAVDAVTGAHRWTYDPHVDGQYARRACCDVVNRGVAYDNGRVYVGTLDGYLIALDAGSGKTVWKADTLIDHSRSYTITGAPCIADGKVVIGNGGADMGVRGYVSAFDLNSGKLAWRFFTVPGDPAKGPDESAAITLARRTWSPRSRWDIGGGGTAWDSIVFDPATDLLLIGVGNGGPHPVWLRSPGGGDNLFLSSIIAVDPRSGALRWYYQTTPGDSWDFTATQNIILAELPWHGRSEKVLMQAPKNGFFYILNRENGALLAADKYTYANWADHVDLATGKAVKTALGDYSLSQKIVWPAATGGHNWQPMSYSPMAGLVYIPVLEGPMGFSMLPSLALRPGSGETGTNVRLPPFASRPSGAPPDTMTASLEAWDPIKKKVAWKTPAASYWSAGGTLATAGGLVFEGNTDGIFNAYSATSGKRLKSIDTGSSIMAAPITYDVDGVQYVAVLAGYGGAYAPLFVPNSAPLRYENPERLIIFKLGGGDVPKPPLRSPPKNDPAPLSAAAVDPQLIARGQSLYLANCARCHAYGPSAGVFPALWPLSQDADRNFEDIVYGGALRYAGMAPFSDVLSKADVLAIRAFLRAAGRPMPAGTPAPH
jgi:quinohemoprotein ethanol dehydrogenase